jgi:hypothetical protein
VSHALTFATSYVNVPDNDLLDLASTWTLEAWVKPANPASGVDQDIISKWAGASTASYILQIDATGRLRLVTNNGATQSIVLSHYHLASNAWYHVAATFDDGTAKLYLNGLLDTTVAGVLTPLVSTEPVAFGREGTATMGTLSAVVDEVRIWNVARSGDELVRNRTKRLSGSEAGLVGYWPLDEESGQLAHDVSGHGLDGRLGDASSADSWDPTWTTDAGPVR